jgi:hypothetical protein
MRHIVAGHIIIAQLIVMTFSPHMFASGYAMRTWLTTLQPKTMKSDAMYQLMMR